MTYTYTISAAQLTFFSILLLWELAWTSIALWRAAQHHQPFWFGVMLIVNTAGILPIIYLLLTRPRKDTTNQRYAPTTMVGR